MYRLVRKTDNFTLEERYFIQKRFLWFWINKRRYGSLDTAIRELKIFKGEIPAIELEIISE